MLGGVVFECCVFECCMLFHVRFNVLRANLVVVVRAFSSLRHKTKHNNILTLEGKGKRKRKKTVNFQLGTPTVLSQKFSKRCSAKIICVRADAELTGFLLHHSCERECVFLHCFEHHSQVQTSLTTTVEPYICGVAPLTVMILASREIGCTVLIWRDVLSHIAASEACPPADGGIAAFILCILASLAAFSASTVSMVMTTLSSAPSDAAFNDAMKAGCVLCRVLMMKRFFSGVSLVQQIITRTEDFFF